MLRMTIKSGILDQCIVQGSINEETEVCSRKRTGTLTQIHSLARSKRSMTFKAVRFVIIEACRQNV